MGAQTPALADDRRMPQAALVSFIGLSYELPEAYRRDRLPLLCLVTEAPDGPERR